MRVFRPLTLFATSAVSALVTPHQRLVLSGTRSFSALNMVSSPSPVHNFLTQEVDNHKVVIFSKSYCPYCTQAKELLLDEVKVEGAKVYELDTMDNGSDIQAALLEMTGQRTVPNIFINKQHVGGNDDVQRAYRSGTLQKLLNSKL